MQKQNFVLSQLKFNMPFIAVALVGLIAILFLVVQGLQRYGSNRQEIERITNEITNFKNNNSTKDFLKTKSQADINKYNDILSYIMPEQEDYFSIFSAIETLATDNNLTASDYSLSFAKNGAEKTTLGVTFEGSQEAFFKFLNSYQYAGGRLATADKIDYGSNGSQKGYRINLSFYTGKAASGSGELVLPSENSFKTLSQIELAIQPLLEKEATFEGATYKKNPLVGTSPENN